MNAALVAIARAFVDVASATPVAQQSALIDAVMEVLTAHGLSSDVRRFPALVKRIAQREDRTVSACLTTVTGQAGSVMTQLHQTIESSLGRPCDLKEKADSSLLGGLLLEIGDERLDASLKHSLQALADRFLIPVPIQS